MSRNLLFFGVSLTAGCGGLIDVKQPDSDNAYFTPPAGPSAVAAAATRPVERDVVIRPLRIRPPFAGQAFIYAAVPGGEVTDLPIDRTDAAHPRAVVAARFVLTEAGSPVIWSVAYARSADLRRAVPHLP